MVCVYGKNDTGYSRLILDNVRESSRKHEFLLDVDEIENKEHQRSENTIEELSLYELVITYHHINAYMSESRYLVLHRNI